MKALGWKSLPARGIRWGATALRVAAVASLPLCANAQVTVTLGQSIDPQVLDPANETLIPSRSIMMNIYDTLVVRSGKGELEPSLAEKWDILDGGQAIRFHLRKGVTFHNGDPFTAADVVFSYRRYTDRESPTPLGAYLRDLITDVEKVDDFTVLIKLPAPSATILGDLNRMPILPEKAFKQMGVRDFGARPVGTGPFKFKHWRRNEEIALEAYDRHWRGRPSIDQYVIKPIPEDFSRFASLSQGDIDIMANLPPDRIPEVEKHPRLKVLTVPSGRGIHIGLNMKLKPFDDVRVREALNYAVNVPLVIETVLGGRGKVNGTVCQHILFGHNPNHKPFGYDPEKAKTLLAEAGYPNGFETQLLGSTGAAIKEREVQDAIAGQLAAVGVKVSLVTPEWADYLDQLYGRGKYKESFQGIYMLGTGGETLDCDRTLLQRIYSKSRLKYYNTANTPIIDELFFKQKSILDPAERLKALYNIQELIRADVPWIFLYDQEDIYAVTRRVQWTPRSDEFVWAFDIKVKE